MIARPLVCRVLLPVALAAVLAWRWLGARVRPAVMAIRLTLAEPAQPPVLAVAPAHMAATFDFAVAGDRVACSFTRRGPPSS